MNRALIRDSPAVLRVVPGVTLICICQVYRTMIAFPKGYLLIIEHLTNQQANE